MGGIGSARSVAAIGRRRHVGATCLAQIYLGDQPGKHTESSVEDPALLRGVGEPGRDGQAGTSLKRCRVGPVLRKGRMAGQSGR